MKPDDIASVAYVDERIGGIQAALIAHLDALDEQSRARDAEWAERKAAADAADAATAAARDKSDAAFLRALEVTRLADVASRLMALPGASVDIALVHATYLVAECERIVDARTVKL